jgi:hypothetical protein
VPAGRFEAVGAVIFNEIAHGDEFAVHSARSMMLTPGDTIRATIGLKKGRSQWQRK